MYFSKAKQRVQIKGNHRIKLGTRQKLQLKNLTQIDAFQVRSVRLRNDNPSTSTYFIQLYPLFYVQSETNKRQQFMLYKIFLLNNADLTHAPSLKLLKPMYFQFFFFLFFFQNKRENKEGTSTSSISDVCNQLTTVSMSYNSRCPSVPHLLNYYPQQLT